MPPLATMTRTSETLAPRYTMGVFSLLCRAFSQCFIYATGGFVHISHSALSMFVIHVCPHFGCCPASHAASCQQGGGSTRTHCLCIFMCCLFSHSSIFREKESSETILLFSDSGGSEVGVSVKTITLGHATRVTDAFLGICLGHGLPGPRVIRFFLRLRLFGSVSFYVPRFRNLRPFLRGCLTRRRLIFLPLCTSLIKSDVSKCILMVFDVY